MNTKSTPKKDIVRRFKIIEGHFRKITQMIEEDSYCIDVLHQTAAVRSAVKKAEELLLNNHLNHCVVQAIRSNGEKKALEELAEVFRKAN